MVVKAFIWPPMASVSRGMSWAERLWVPLKSMCSMKWAAPDSAAVSSREPPPIQIPRAAERTVWMGSVTKRTPLGRVSSCTIGVLLPVLSRGAGGRPSSVLGTVGTAAGYNLRRGFPPLSGAGIQAFSKRKPRRKESQGVPPCTPWNKTARWGSLHLLGRCPLRPSLSGSCAPDQIWKRIFGENIFCWILLCEKSSQRKSPKRQSPNQGPYMGSIKTHDRPAASLSPKQSERAASGLKNRGPGAKPLVFFPPFLT